MVRIANPDGGMGTTSVNCPARIPRTASASSGRRLARLNRPRYPPRAAVVSMDFSLARTPKSAPALSCLRIAAASSARAVMRTPNSNSCESAACCAWVSGRNATRAISTSTDPARAALVRDKNFQLCTFSSSVRAFSLTTGTSSENGLTEERAELPVGRSGCSGPLLRKRSSHSSVIFG